MKSIDYAHTARRWPRVVAMVHDYCGDKMLAARYVAKAFLGEKLYVEIVRYAFTTRHKRRDRKWTA